MDDGVDMTDDLLAEQVRYYRERAPEYDATSHAEDDPYADVEARSIADLRALGPVGRAIELGAGTGEITGVVASLAGAVIAVDSSPEALGLLRRKVPATNVETVAADVFTWVPDERADLVVFRALLSHVPGDRLEAFWSAVDRLLVPGGRAFVIDESAHGLWAEEATGEDEVVVRTLRDGRRFRIVKVLWDPQVLAGRLAELGWRARLTRADPFYWGTVERS